MRRISKLIGVILSDGSVDKKRYTVSFTEDKDVVERLIKEFEEIENINLNWRIDQQVNSFRARVYSKKLVDLLFKFSPSFRTRSYDVHPKCECLDKGGYPPTKIPLKIILKPNLIKLFLRYYITCDGGPEFSLYKRNDKNVIQLHVGIKIGCDNPIIKDQMHHMLNIIGIKANKKKSGLSIRKLSEIKKFHKLVGFLEESKVRRGKLFKNYKKNDVIKLIIFCGYLTSKFNWINKNFQNIENLEIFLINCIKLVNNRRKLANFVKTKLNFYTQS